MVVIYAAQYSPRLQYIASFIFNDLLDTPFQIITDPHVFKTTEAIKISYGQSRENDTITIPFAANLLFEKTITIQ